MLFFMEKIVSNFICSRYDLPKPRAAIHIPMETISRISSSQGCEDEYFSALLTVAMFSASQSLEWPIAE